MTGEHNNPADHARRNRDCNLEISEALLKTKLSATAYSKVPRRFEGFVQRYQAYVRVWLPDGKREKEAE